MPGNVQLAIVKAVASHPELLEGTGLVPFLLRERAAPDYDKFLSGAPLTQDEVPDLLVPRRVIMHNRVFSPVEFDSWLGQQRETAVVLTGDAGEGKSSYVTHLCCRVSTTHLVLRWQPSTIFNLQAAATFRDVVRTYLPKGHAENVPVLVVIEMTSPLLGAEGAALMHGLGEREFDPAAIPLLSVVLLGRPGWTGLLRRRLSLHHLRLAPLDDTEAHALAVSIETAYRECRSKNGPDELTQTYPNLSNFVKLSDEAKLEMLAEGSPPLITSMLKAVYGRDFHRRLTDEYVSLSHQDRLAYLALCLAANRVGEMSEDLLTRLVPEADVESRCRRDPWVRTDAGSHAPRHAVIARTVVGEAAGGTEIKEVFKRLLECGTGDPEARQVLQSTFYEFAHWEPVARERNTKTSPQLRGYARQALAANESLWLSFETNLPNVAEQLSYWAYLLLGLLPDEPGLSKANELLFERAETLLDAIPNAFTDDPIAMAERRTFYKVRLSRDRNRIWGDNLVDDVADVRILRRLVGKAWCGSDFYGELVAICARGCSSRLNTGDFDEEDTESWLLLETLVIAFQHLRAVGEIRRHIQAMYADVVGRRIHVALNVRKAELLRTAWNTSIQLGCPDGAVASMLDHELHKSSTKTTETNRLEDLNREREALLFAAAKGDPGYAEVLLRLARFVVARPSLKASALELVEAALRIGPSGIALAMSLHAKSLLCEGGDNVEEFLAESIGLYLRSIRTHNQWLIWGPMCLDAINVLRRINPARAGEMLVHYRASQVEFGAL